MEWSLEVGEGSARRRLAVQHRPGSRPTIVWLGGFRSDMTGAKAEALDRWAAEIGHSCLRFDYSGHGASGGRFEDGTITRWLEEALTIIDARAGERPVLVGSSMGGWIALLAARALAARDPARAPAALVLVAPAVDFTERLMWDGFSPEDRAELARSGMLRRPSGYSSEPYPITRELIEDGRRHLMLDDMIEIGCPVHIIQGMHDADVPWEHAMRLVERLPDDDVRLTLVPDGDHRLSRPEDLDRLIAAVETAVERAGPSRATVSSS